MEPGLIRSIGSQYLDYLNYCLDQVAGQQEVLDSFFEKMKNAHAIHIFGFGRSGGAASSLAIRLRHFSDCLPPVWWMGDQVRETVRENDLVIFFSKTGERREVIPYAVSAQGVGATVVLVSSVKGSSIGRLASLEIIIPPWENHELYGGGDFELASYFMQELIISAIGSEFHIPREVVDENHV